MAAVVVARLVGDQAADDRARHQATHDRSEIIVPTVACMRPVMPAMFIPVVPVPLVSAMPVIDFDDIALHIRDGRCREPKRRGHRGSRRGDGERQREGECEAGGKDAFHRVLHIFAKRSHPITLGKLIQHVARTAAAGCSARGLRFGPSAPNPATPWLRI